jgi:hypothetical protein
MEADRTKPWLTRWLPALLAAGLLALALLHAGRHLGDLSRIRHLAGIWMGLAWYLDAGVFYPPLESDGCYAGTRYMPLLFALIAGLARITGSYLVAAKLVALGSTLLLIAGLVLVLRRITGRWQPGLVGAGLLLAFPEGFQALCSPHADALPVAFTLLGLWILVDREPTLPRTSLAAGLFALAVGTKFSAVAGPLSAGLFLYLRYGRSASLRLLLPWLALVLLELVVFQVASDGRFLVNFRSLGSGGMNLATLTIGPARLGLALARPTPFLVVWPVALGLVVVALRNSQMDLWNWYLLTSGATTLVIFTSPGTDFNHLLELQAASVILMLRFLEHTETRPAWAVRLVGGGVLLGVLGLALAGVLSTLSEPDPSAIQPAELLAALPPGPILTEDATPTILRNERPVVLDPFAFRVLAEQGRIDPDRLIQRVEQQQFTALVLMGRIDRPEESLAPRFHFGPRLTESVRQHYQFERVIGGYYVFVPRRVQ